MRYLRLYLYFLRFSFSKAMHFRVNFFFRVVMDIAFYAVQIGFFQVVYRHTTLLGGWTIDQVYLFVTAFLLLDAVHMTFFSSNLWHLPILVNKGDLDYYLVRPIAPLFVLSLREFAANSFLNLLIALGLVVWALVRYPQPLGWSGVMAFALLLLFGVLLQYLLRMLFLIPVFWLHAARGLDEVVWSLGRLGEQPHQIYHPMLQRALLTVLPLGLLASMPTHVLFGEAIAPVLLHTGAVTTAFALLVLWFWRRGLKAYASASS